MQPALANGMPFGNPLAPSQPRFEPGIEKDDVDHWHSEAIVTIFDTAGAVVPPTGCMRAVGERMQ